MQSTEIAIKDGDNFYKSKNAIINVLQSYYGAFKIIYTIVQYKPNLGEPGSDVRKYWTEIENELSEAIYRSQVEMKELDLVIQTFNMLSKQLKCFKTDIEKYNLSTVVSNSYPAVKALNDETIPKCFENIAKIQGVSLEKCSDNFKKILPIIGAENFMAKQEELAKLKNALNLQIEAKNSVLSSDQYTKLSNEVELRKVNVAKLEVTTPSLEKEIKEINSEKYKIEGELEEILKNGEAYLKSFESKLGNIDQVESEQLDKLLTTEQNELRESKSNWDQKISESQSVLKQIQEKIIDPDAGFFGGLKKCLNLARPFLSLYNPVLGVQSFDTGSKEPTVEELMKLTEIIEKQQKTFVDLSIQESDNIIKKFEKMAEKVKSQYNQLRETSDKLKGNRESAWKARKEDLTIQLNEIKKELEEKNKILTKDTSDLAANREQLKTSLEVFRDFVQTNMEDKQKYIKKLRTDIERLEEDIMTDLRQTGQSTPQTAYHFLNAVQEMNKIIQVNIQLMGGAANFTSTSMITIRSHFQMIDETISKPDDNPRFWMDFLKYLNEIYENSLKCTWAKIKIFTYNTTEENFKNLNFNHPDYSEDLKNSIQDYFTDFKEQNNPLDKNEKKKKDIEINCDKLYEVFNFSSFTKELQEIK